MHSSKYQAECENILILWWASQLQERHPSQSLKTDLEDVKGHPNYIKDVLL